MLLRTHLAFGIFAAFLFISHVNNKITFLIMVLISSAFLDLDTPDSSWGRHWIFRPLQIFVKHRGIIHSFTAAVIFSFILAIVWPVASLGFFLGYSVHLITDSFTKEGIQPFWPLKYRSKGFIKTGGRIEDSLFVFLILADAILMIFSLLIIFA